VPDTVTDLITVALSSSDRLYLTQAEADRLAEQVRQELVCRTTDHTDEPVMVADILLTVAEAWRLVDKLVPIEDEVDWQNEGF
jgi:pantothenate kinase-related protein Tda10